MLSMDEWRQVFQEQMREAKPGDAWSLRKAESLDAHSSEPGWKKAVHEHAHASFMCSQCYHMWSSSQVVILFHMYRERSTRQGRVRMRPFWQECHNCLSTRKEEPQFSREDVESVVQRLILDIREKCYRERVHRGELSEVVVCEGRGPHKSEACEACQMGLHKGHHGKSDGARHHGKSDGALHLGKSDGAWCHGKSYGELHDGSSQSPGYSWTPTLHRYQVSPIHTPRRRLIQSPEPSAVSTACPPCCICCVIIAAACVIVVLIAYWKGWFKG